MPERSTQPHATQREVTGLRFRFFNADGSTTELPVALSHMTAKHRPLDRRKTWLDVRKGNHVVLWYPGKAPEVRRVDQVILWAGRPPAEGLPEIVSGRDWIGTGTILDPRRSEQQRTTGEAACIHWRRLERPSRVRGTCSSAGSTPLDSSAAQRNAVRGLDGTGQNASSIEPAFK